MSAKASRFYREDIRAVFVLIASVTLAFLAVRQPLPLPDADSIGYIAYARSLVVAGTYARTPDGPSVDLLPGREPLYSALLAGAAAVVPSIREAVVVCAPPAESCKAGFRGLQFLNFLLMGGAALLSMNLCRRAGGSRLASVIAGGYVVFNLHMYKDARYLISDFLAVGLGAAVSWSMFRAVRQPQRLSGWLVAGGALSLLTLTKAIFLPFAVMVTLGALGAGLARYTRQQEGARAFGPALILAGVLAISAGAWTARNLALFGVTDDGRAGVALSTREVFDHMTPSEHLAAFLWWTRGPGTGLAKRLLPETAWHRHEWYVPDGFYVTGQFANPELRLRRLTQAGLSPAQAEAATPRVVVGEILDHISAYLATMPVLFYRGLWFDEFIIFGFPALLWLVWRSARRRDWPMIAALAPGLWSLLVYPAVSLNIPRYQFPAVIALALAAALAVDALRQARRVSAARSEGIDK
ncbi:MAG: hypothetical protein HQL37_00945 [Alphaproteobacteria bacterium]|nr:hypothetical protein [Alphaproteobacteria bacterium]